LARPPPAAHVARDPPAQPGQGLGELDHAAVLVLVPDLAPAVVVAVLLAPARVPAGGLDVPTRTGADPDLGPRRRDGQPANALECGFGLDLPTLSVQVLEVRTPAPPAEAG